MSAIPSTSWQKAISGNPVKNDTGTILGVNDVSNVNGLPIIENTTNTGSVYGSKLALAVSPASSGNIGTAKAISGGRFSNLTAGDYIIRGITTTIAGSASTILKSGASDVGGPRGRNAWYGYRRQNITSWNYETGAATKGAGDGDLVLASGINGTTGIRADHANSYVVPGELTYQKGANLAVNDDYKVSTNP